MCARENRIVSVMAAFALVSGLAGVGQAQKLQGVEPVNCKGGGQSTVNVGCETGSMTSEELEAPLQPVSKRRSLELVYQQAQLDDMSVVLDPRGASPGELERVRSGAKFSWWRGKSSRSFLQVFNEEWNDLGPSRTLYHGTGIGIGLEGVGFFGRSDADVRVVLPYRLGVDWGQAKANSSNPIQARMSNVDAYLDLALGLNWRGLQPSFGVSVHDRRIELNPPGDDDSSDDPHVHRSGVSGFFDLEYQEPGASTYFRLRAQVGEEEMVSFGFGLSF